MIFVVSRGSDGVGSERYLSYLPFVLGPSTRVEPLEEPVTFTYGDLTLKLEKLHHVYALASGPFASPEEATLNLTKLRACLLWASLTFGIGMSYSKSSSRVRLQEHPTPIAEDNIMVYPIAKSAGWTAIDGDYEAESALVIPDHRRLLRWETGRPSVIAGINVRKFLDAVSEAIGFEGLPRVADNAKLQLGIELYAAYRFELSRNAQFITLVSALESLLPKVQISQPAVVALEKAKETVKVVRDNHAQNSDEWNAINHLLSRLDNLRTEAIGTHLRKYISAVVTRNPKLGNPDDISYKLRSAYDTRSTLLHEGSVSEATVNEHLSFLSGFVPQLLGVLFKEAMGLPPDHGPDPAPL